MAPTYWKSICETELELTEFKTHDAKPTVGTSPQKTPASGYELSRLPVASSLDADKNVAHGQAACNGCVALYCRVGLVEADVI